MVSGGFGGSNMVVDGHSVCLSCVETSSGQEGFTICHSLTSPPSQPRSFMKSSAKIAGERFGMSGDVHPQVGRSFGSGASGAPSGQAPAIRQVVWSPSAVTNPSTSLVSTHRLKAQRSTGKVSVTKLGRAGR